MPWRLWPTLSYSSFTGFAGISERRNSTVSRTRPVSAWKYERAKLNTTWISSGTVSTASGRTPSGGCPSGTTSGRMAPEASRSRATRYAPLLRKKGKGRTSAARAASASAPSCSRAARAQSAASPGRSAKACASSVSRKIRSNSSGVVPSAGYSRCSGGASGAGHASQSAVNSLRRSTPTVPRTRRTTELKKVAAISASGRPRARSAYRVLKPASSAAPGGGAGTRPRSAPTTRSTSRGYTVRRSAASSCAARHSRRRKRPGARRVTSPKASR